MIIIVPSTSRETARQSIGDTLNPESYRQGWCKSGIIPLWHGERQVLFEEVVGMLRKATIRFFDLGLWGFRKRFKVWGIRHFNLVVDESK